MPRRASWCRLRNYSRNRPAAPSRSPRLRNSFAFLPRSNRPVGAHQDLTVASALVGVRQRILDLVDRVNRVDRRLQLAGHDLGSEPGIDLTDLLGAALGQKTAEHETGEPDAPIDEVAAPDLGILAAHR